jgi:thioredoxin 1
VRVLTGLMCAGALVFAGLQVIPVALMQRDHARFQEQLEAKARSALEVSFLDPAASLAEDIGRLLGELRAEYAPGHVQVSFDAASRRLSAQVWYARRHRGLLFANPQQFYARVSAGGAGTPRPAGPLALSDASFSRDVLSAQTPVMVMFWAPWCGFCRQALPSLDEASRVFAGRMIIAKLNTDDHREAASRYGIRGIPTFAFFKRGKVVTQTSGWGGHEDFMRLIREHL